MAVRIPTSSPLFRKPARRVRSERPAARGRAKPALKIAPRPPAPPFWRNIAPALRNLPDAPSRDRARYWRLVLESKGVPHRFFEKGLAPSLYVPPVAAEIAVREIDAFEQERAALPPAEPPAHRGAAWFAVLLALLVPWHRIRWSPAPICPFFPASPQEWTAIAGLDAYRVCVLHEWHRAVTALTLHADGAHLLSNLVMGCVFGLPLCRRVGVGFGFLLTLVAGCLGNLATAHMRPAYFLSQGFSTAVFAAAGLLAAFSAATAARGAYAVHAEARGRAAVRAGLVKALPPLGAGMGFLALLGGSGAPGVDYLAHTMGLVAGTMLGFAVAVAAPAPLFTQGKHNAAAQWTALAAAAALLCAAWARALTPPV